VLRVNLVRVVLTLTVASADDSTADAFKQQNHIPPSPSPTGSGCVGHTRTDCNGRVVCDAHRLRPLEYSDQRFDSHSKQGLRFIVIIYALSSRRVCSWTVCRQMIGAWWIGKNLEISGRSAIEVLFRHFPGSIEKTTRGRCLGRDSNWAPPEKESRTLLLRLPCSYNRCYLSFILAYLRPVYLFMALK
jgi:hypothetical protein